VAAGNAGCDRCDQRGYKEIITMMLPNTALEPTPRTPSDSRKASGCCCVFVRRGSAFGR
jgi:hypothetical protein